MQIIEELYLPIDSVRGKKDVTEFNELNDFSHESQIVASCFDGVLMAILVNMVEHLIILIYVQYICNLLFSSVEGFEFFE